ncbi:MAG: transposase family protein [Planctomycetes bacterium]|nr:transposase family protein [Planctomycetota bacterium]
MIRGGIVKYSESLSDPRDARNRRHLLIDVIVIAVCLVIVGCNGPTSIERWAKVKQECLGKFLSAWANEQGIALEQRATEEKSNDSDGTERADGIRRTTSPGSAASQSAC